jgi:hypothetical protein
LDSSGEPAPGLGAVTPVTRFVTPSLAWRRSCRALDKEEEPMTRWNRATRLRQKTATLAIVVLAAASLLGASATPVLAGGPPNWARTKDGAKRWKLLKNFNNEAALDGETGLIWEVSPSTSNFTFREATTICLTRVVGGRQGFRLPTAAEFSSIVDTTQDNLTVAGTPFVLACETAYWTSTIQEPLPTETNLHAQAFTTGIDSNCAFGGNILPGTVTNHHRVICVRGPGGN